MKRIIKYFVTRRTKHDNYRVGKHKGANGQKYYTVKYKSWLVGWHTEQEEYDSVTSFDKIFDKKEDAKSFIEDAINEAYKELYKLN
jgi:hypothetical protein